MRDHLNEVPRQAVSALRDLATTIQGLNRARQLVADLDRVDKPVDRRQVADGVRHELDAALLWLHSEQERLRAAAAGDRPGKVRADAPATSRATAARIVLKSGTARTRVLRALYDAPDGLTDWEIQSGCGIPPSTERPRRGELVDAGLVAASGRTRQHNGEDWTVWSITTSGVAAIRRISPDLPPVEVADDAPQPGLF